MHPLQADWHISARFLCSALVSLLLAGCNAAESPPPSTQANIPTPTVAPFFSNPESPTPSQLLTSTKQPQATPTTELTAPTRAADQVATIPIYDDKLNADWSAQQSTKMRYDLAATAYVHSGKTAIAITPTDDFGRFFLTVRKDARKIYPRDRILGVSFWLNSGEGTIATSDLAFTAVGSNQYAYWVADDNSVQINATVTAESPLFSETRLYFLHINRSIPPNSWVEVIVWLDDLIHDPNYTNLTGIYIKNDEGFLKTFYIDDIQLLVQK